MDFLKLAGKCVLVLGVANKKSVAYAIGQSLEQAGATVIYAVRSIARAESLSKLLAGKIVLVCDVEQQDQIDRLADDLTKELAGRNSKLAGIVHSIAFADYSDGIKPFHETTRKQFLQAIDISCFSLVAICNGLRDVLAPDAAVVTISISTTRMASESYGFMAPVKAALDSSIVFLAKSFSRFSNVRFNAVGAGLLKTSASAGIPGYVDAYLYAEQATLRNKAVQTAEAADVATFLISPRSSGINAQTIVVDAGMSTNYFDQAILDAFAKT